MNGPAKNVPSEEFSDEEFFAHPEKIRGEEFSSEEISGNQFTISFRFANPENS
jgi:hypothetical protein